MIRARRGARLNDALAAERGPMIRARGGGGVGVDGGEAGAR